MTILTLSTALWLIISSEHVRVCIAHCIQIKIEENTHSNPIIVKFGVCLHELNKRLLQREDRSLQNMSAIIVCGKRSALFQPSSPPISSKRIRCSSSSSPPSFPSLLHHLTTLFPFMDPQVLNLPFQYCLYLTGFFADPFRDLDSSFWRKLLRNVAMIWILLSEV